MVYYIHRKQRSTERHTIMISYDYPTLTIQFGATFLQTAIDFVGYDYRTITEQHVNDYQTIRVNPINGAVALFNRGGQWSRETTITIYPSMAEYRKVVDAHALKTAKLNGWQ